MPISLPISPSAPSAPTDVILQTEPPYSDVPLNTRIRTRATFVDRDTRLPVAPAQVQLTYHLPGAAAVTLTGVGAIVQETAGGNVYHYDLGPPMMAGKLRLTWQALDGSLVPQGSAETMLYVVEQQQ